MNVQSNTYTLIYSSVMVIIVAAGLSFAALKLQPRQEKNIEIEKKQNILASVKIESTPEDAEKKYDEYIKNSFVVNSEGEIVDGQNAFKIDLKAEMEKDLAQRNLPVFECIKDNDTVYIIPLRGKGLWGPIWGYVSLEKDFNTIYGAVFDHKGETPGLGAEINTHEFQEQFIGKKIFDGDALVAIVVYKGGSGAAVAAGNTTNGIDGISGGTITSKGLEDMMKNSLSPYEKYFKENKK